MSILLDALRKSEKDQNRPVAPDIHSDDASSRPADSIQTAPLAILLVLALFVSGWFVWNQYQAPDGLIQATETPAAGSNKAAATEQAAAAVQKTQTAHADAPAGQSEGRPRTPVESYQQPAGTNSTAISVAHEKPVPANMKPLANQPVKDDKKPPVAARTTAKSRPHEPAPISYWELPDAIRADVAEIKFSVLVYARQPADRFVLINGQRLVEGDSAQAGLVVEEIRRDGVVFSYRLYQFLVER